VVPIDLHLLPNLQVDLGLLLLDFDEGNASGASLVAGEAQAEEMAKECHRGLHTHEGLAVKCEDRQEEDGVGLEMQCLDLVIGEDGKEEWR
jgi:hypothetical protein